MFRSPVPRRLTAAAAALALLAGGAPLRAQGAAEAPSALAAPAAPAAPGRPLLQHSFPLAGQPLVLVVDGMAPHAGVALQLLDPARAPPSVVAALMTGAGHSQFRNGLLQEPDRLTTLWEADDFGRVVLSIPLSDPADGGRALALLATLVAGAVQSEPLRLAVLPPTLLLPAEQGIVRISLLDGSQQLPALPAAGGLRGAALSSDGILGYVLRDGGLLEVRATHQWDAEPLARRLLDPATDILAGNAAAGAAFALARPAGLPFTPGALLQFLGDAFARRDPLLLEPMGQAVSGRRVALTADGLSAFLAEDDLLVREIDLLTGVARGRFAVGLAGDRAIADMVVAGRRLLVVTRGPLGRRGSLTSYDLDAGVLATHDLDIDPLRLVALATDGPPRVLVVPAAGRAFQLLEAGLPAATHVAMDGRWLDAVAVDRGALLLRETAGGSRLLERLDLAGGPGARGQLRPTGIGLAAPVTRMTGGGAGAVVLLGDPSGTVHVLRPGADSTAPLPGVTALPGETFAVLP